VSLLPEIVSQLHKNCLYIENTLFPSTRGFFVSIQSSIVAEFSVGYSRFLDPFGVLTQELPPSLNNPELLLKLYEFMVLNRVFDAKAVALQRTGKMGTYPSSAGQEAIGVGVGAAMKDGDVLVPYYRDHGAHLVRGGKIEEIYWLWGGDERGSDFSTLKEDFPVSVPIASQCLHAVGVAKAFQYRKQKRAAVTFVGDGGTSKGDFYEALNVAGAWKLPVLFVINNNYWAISVPLSEQTACKTLAQKGIAAEVKGEQVDGNDVLAVQYATDKALNAMREGSGPYIIEALTYRMCDHTTADDAKRYQPPQDVEKHKAEDPILRLRAYLVSRNLWNEEQEKALYARVKQTVEQAVHTYESIAPQHPSAIFDYLYAELPSALIEQRDTLLAHLGESHE
jgi:2-oxoisovalerate dehydrogenase E1 component alpha subunit